jgi:KTSC domain
MMLVELQALASDPMRGQPFRTWRPGGEDRHMTRRSTDIPVDSSLIRSVTYGTDATLTVRFHSGTVYRYFTVPRTVLDQFLTATSKGVYFNRHIRERFPCQRVDYPHEL